MVDYAAAADRGYSRAWLDKYPEVRNVVDKSIKNNWGQARLEVEIRKTKWYRNRDRDEKRWSTISIEEPAQAERLIADARTDVKRYARLMGVPVSSKELDKWAKQAAIHGWDEIDMRQAIAASLTKKDVDDPNKPGDLSNLIAQIEQYEEEYLVRFSPDRRLKLAKRLVRGEMSMEDVQSQFINTAARQYRGVADDIRAGQSVADIMSPYLQIAAEELGITPGSINLFDGKWTAALSGGEGGRAMTSEEWQKQIRTQNRYGYKNTRKAKNEAAALANGIMGIFGAR